VGAYALFWFALVVAVNAFGASSATNAMVLVIAWVLLVLVAPVLLNLAVTQASPAPSRTELATRQRVVTAEAMKRHADLMSADYQHVGRGADSLAARRQDRNRRPRCWPCTLIEREVDEAIRPELDRFDAQQARTAGAAGQLRRGVARGGSLRRHDRAGRHRHAAPCTLRRADGGAPRVVEGASSLPRIDARDALTPADFDRIPSFAWQEESAGLVRNQAALGRAATAAAEPVAVRRGRVAAAPLLRLHRRRLRP
jgi:ABC-2 type transport system permease protein